MCYFVFLSHISQFFFFWRTGFAYVNADIPILDQNVDDKDGDIDDELEAAKLAGKKKKSKKNKKKIKDDEDILMETPTADGLVLIVLI